MYEQLKVYVLSASVFERVLYPSLKAVTVGTGWVAAATSKRHVRLFTISGIQQEIFSIPGPVVSMAAHSNQLMVIYHKGQGEILS